MRLGQRSLSRHLDVQLQPLAAIVHRGDVHGVRRQPKPVCAGARRQRVIRRAIAQRLEVHFHFGDAGELRVHLLADGIGDGGSALGGGLRRHRDIDIDVDCIGRAAGARTHDTVADGGHLRGGGGHCL